MFREGPLSAMSKRDPKSATDVVVRRESFQCPFVTQTKKKKEKNQTKLPPFDLRNFPPPERTKEVEWKRKERRKKQQNKQQTHQPLFSVHRKGGRKRGGLSAQLFCENPLPFFFFFDYLFVSGKKKGKTGLCTFCGGLLRCFFFFLLSNIFILLFVVCWSCDYNFIRMACWDCVVCVRCVVWLICYLLWLVDASWVVWCTMFPCNFPVQPCCPLVPRASSSARRCNRFVKGMFSGVGEEIRVFTKNQLPGVAHTSSTESALIIHSRQRQHSKKILCVLFCFVFFKPICCCNVSVRGLE